MLTLMIRSNQAIVPDKHANFASIKGLIIFTNIHICYTIDHCTGNITSFGGGEVSSQSFKPLTCNIPLENNGS